MFQAFSFAEANTKRKFELMDAPCISAYSIRPRKRQLPIGWQNSNSSKTCGKVGVLSAIIHYLQFDLVPQKLVMF